MLVKEVKEFIHKSVLCWLATCNKELIPNVSPKEIFTCYDSNTIIIANIASPNSILNIKENPNVCISFIDIFVQKGYKIKGIATLIERDNPDYDTKVNMLMNLYTDEFPVKSVIEIKVTQVDTILAPSYMQFPETTEVSQIASAMKTYRVQPI